MSLRPNLFAERVLAVSNPATVAVSNRMREMQRAGIDVVEFAGGDPDFPTPAHIIDAAVAAMRAGDTHYVASRGIPELREAIAAKFERDNGLQYDPAREILVTPSGKHALFCATMTLLDKGDEAIILDPSWVTYEACVRLAGATPVSVPLVVDDNFRITAEKLARAASPRSKLLIINSPNNPTGRVLDTDELAAIAAFAQEHNLVVIADEMYEKIIFDGRPHVSLATLPGMRERTLTLNGFSKAYAMTGWRLGYIAGPADMIAQILKVHEQSVSCAASFAQRGGVAALTGSQECVEMMAAEYQARRDLIVEGLNRLPGVRCHLPEGAFYAFPDIRGTGMSSAEFAEFAISEAHVALTAGDSFGAAGEGHVRLSFATSRERIVEGLERLARALAKRRVAASQPAAG